MKASRARPTPARSRSRNGKTYPPKAVFGLAIRRHLGRDATTGDFEGGADTLCFRVLQDLGFQIQPKAGADSSTELPSQPTTNVWVEITRQENRVSVPGW